MSTATHWSYGFWLVFDSNGKVRQTVREPAVARDERKMLVHASLPKSLWSSPALRATITVTEDNTEPKFTIDLQAAGDAMRQALGVDIDMRIVPPAPELIEEIDNSLAARAERGETNL